MRRSAAALALARRLCSSGQAGALTAAAGRLLQCGASAASRSPVAAAAAALQRPSWRCFSAEGGGDSGGESGDNVPGDREAWEAVSQLSAEATQMAEEGDPAGAKQRLRDELPGLAEKYGREDPAVGLIYNQLALWSFFDGDYGEAVEAAQNAHTVWVKEMGEDSQAAIYHGIRLGMALAAAGHPEEAFPLLEKGLSVAVDNYNHHIEKLEQMLPMSEDGGAAAAAEGPSEQDEAVMAARAQEQRVSLAMIEKLGKALQEAKFYRALSFLGITGREINEKWDDKGAGAVFFLQQEMSDAVTDMLRWVPPDHPTVQSALREHGRLVAQCDREGLRQLHDDLQIHHQRLQDVVHEAQTTTNG